MQGLLALLEQIEAKIIATKRPRKSAGFHAFSYPRHRNRTAAQLPGRGSGK